MEYAPYNPLDKLNLGNSVAEAMLETRAHPLGVLEPFTGAGIYAVYYSIFTFIFYLPSTCHAERSEASPRRKPEILRADAFRMTVKKQRENALYRQVRALPVLERREQTEPFFHADLCGQGSAARREKGELWSRFGTRSGSVQATQGTRRKRHACGEPEYRRLLERFRFVFLLLSPLRWKVILKREALKNLMENTGKTAGDASLRSA